MTCDLYLSLSESFAEARLAFDNESRMRRWPIAKESLDKGLSAYLKDQAVTELAQVLIETRWPHHLIRKRLGTSPALLVTSGFENWLELNSPLQSPHFSLNPQRATAIWDSNLTFGVSERSSPEQGVIKPVDESELEFLAAKLEMNQVQCVAIGFLHSVSHPENELKVEEYLTEKGFKVFSSHKVSSEPNEIPRWMSTLMTAYIFPHMSEIDSQVRAGLESAGFADLNPRYMSGDLKSYSILDKEKILLSLFGLAGALKIYLSQTQNESLTYLGLEDIFDLNRNDQTQDLWQSPYGPLALIHPGALKSSIQPTQLIDRSFWGAASFTQVEAGYEPGPMCLGKGLQPTLLDLMACKTLITEVEGLSERYQPKAISRIQEVLLTLSRPAQKNSDFEAMQIVDHLLAQARRRLIKPKQQQMFLGPMVDIISKGLQLKESPQIRFQKISVTEILQKANQAELH